MTLGLATCFAAACGGQSVRRVDTNDDEKELDGSDGVLGANELDACVSVCVACFAEQRSCEKDCGQILEQAEEAGCAEALDALLACRIDLVSCSATSCAKANNDLSVCVIGYCDGHPNAAVCTSPL